MSVVINVVREREPWGPGAWSAEVIDRASRAVIFTTDYLPRSQALREAARIARERGLEVLPC